MSRPEPVHSTAKGLAQYLRDQIVSGDLAPGEFVPSERDLMARHDLGREAVRRAVGELRKEGLVELVRGEGWAVRYPERRQAVRLRRGSRVTARMPSPQERRDHDMDEGVPLVVVVHGGVEQVYPGDRFEFTTG